MKQSHYVRLSSVALAVILSGLSAGFFATYQFSVIRGLAQVGDTTYVIIFKAINDTIRNPAFGIVFFGTAPAIAMMLWTHRHRSSRTLIWLTVALLLAIATLLITYLGNIPLNNALAEIVPLTPDIASAARTEFEAPWNTLNLFRTLTSLGALCCVVMAISPRRQRRY